MVLFFDIDGTLLDHSGRVPVSAGEALKQTGINSLRLKNQMTFCTSYSIIKQNRYQNIE